MKKVEFDYLDFNAYIKLRAKWDAMNALQYDEDTADLDNEIELDEIKLELKQYELNLSKFFENMGKNNWFRLAKKFNIHLKEKNKVSDEIDSDFISDEIEMRAIMDLV
mgnify:CR=1 FL=1